MSEMTILSMGDRVAPGIYARRRTFARSAHYRDGDRWLFLVDESIDAGPMNLMARGIFLETPPEVIEVRAHEIHFHGSMMGVVARSVIPVFDSGVISGWRGDSRVIQRLSALVAEMAPERSLAALLDERRDEAFRGAFDRAFLSQARHGAAMLACGEIEAGAASLRGVGYGLTPSGDDFLAGYALGCHVAGRRERAAAVRQAAFRDAPLVDAFVALAAEGRASAAAKRLIERVTRDEMNWDVVDDENDAREAARALMDCGATSGGDFAAGLCLALRDTRDVGEAK